MDDDSLDEFVDRSLGLGGYLGFSFVVLVGDIGESIFCFFYFELGGKCFLFTFFRSSGGRLLFGLLVFGS